MVQKKFYPNLLLDGYFYGERSVFFPNHLKLNSRFLPLVSCLMTSWHSGQFSLGLVKMIVVILWHETRVQRGFLSWTLELSLLWLTANCFGCMPPWLHPMIVIETRPQHDVETMGPCQWWCPDTLGQTPVAAAYLESTLCLPQSAWGERADSQ